MVCSGDFFMSIKIGLQVFYFIQIMLDVCVCQFVIGKVTGQILVVGAHVDQAVSGKVEENNFFFAYFLAFFGLIDCGRNGMAGFRCGDDTLCFGKKTTCIKGFQLLDVGSFHQIVFQKLGYDDAGAMITKTACMYVGWGEVMAEREHRK